MDHVALVTVMGQLHTLFFQMLRHGHHLNGRFGSGLDDLIMTTETKVLDLQTLFHRKLADDLAILDMVGIRAMTELTGNRLMDTGLMDKTNWPMTFKAGIIGLVANDYIPLIFNVTTPVMTILPHGLGIEHIACEQPKHSGNN